MMFKLATAVLCTAAVARREDPPLVSDAVARSERPGEKVLPRASHRSGIGKRVMSHSEWAWKRSAAARLRHRALESHEGAVETRLETGIGTHFAYLWAGTPPQRQSVILDTGSFHTGFPCDPCTDCGDYLEYHEGPPFDPGASSTYVSLGGTWNAAYSEGDGWHAHTVRDRLYLGGDTAAEVAGAEGWGLTFDFGCMYQMGGLFITQYANGIMGFGMSAETIVPHLMSTGQLTHKSFAFCFAVDGGTLALGGANTNLHSEPMDFAYLKQYGSFWGVTFKDLWVNGVTIGAAASTYGAPGSTIVDSGTTYTYVPTALGGPFKAAWRAATGFDYDTSGPLDASVDVSTLPELTFVLEKKGGGDVLVRVGPSGYLDDWYGHLYPSLWFEGGTKILGANVMTDHDVYFNWQDMEVGWAPATCEWSGGTLTQSPLPAPTSFYTPPAPSGAPSTAPPVPTPPPVPSPTLAPQRSPMASPAPAPVAPPVAEPAPTTPAPTSTTARGLNRTVGAGEEGTEPPEVSSGGIVLLAIGATVAVLFALRLLVIHTSECRKGGEGDDDALHLTDAAVASKITATKTSRGPKSTVFSPLAEVRARLGGKGRASFAALEEEEAEERGRFGEKWSGREHAVGRHSRVATTAVVRGNGAVEMQTARHGDEEGGEESFEDEEMAFEEAQSGFEDYEEAHGEEEELNDQEMGVADKTAML